MVASCAGADRSAGAIDRSYRPGVHFSRDRRRKALICRPNWLMVRAVNLLSAVLTLPMAVAAAAAAHYLAARAVKAVLWSVSPLSTGEPQAFTYERDVYRTAEPATLQIVGAVLRCRAWWCGWAA